MVRICVFLVPKSGENDRRGSGSTYLAQDFDWNYLVNLGNIIYFILATYRGLRK